MFMFAWMHAWKNIYRQRKRYRLFVPLLLVCALLSGCFLSIAAPCRQFSEQNHREIGMELTETDRQRELQDANARQLGQAASMIQTGVLLVGAVAVLYVSSLMIGERFSDIGILYSVGLTRRQIFFSFFTELCTVCVLVIGAGLTAGSRAAVWWLAYRIRVGVLPTGLEYYIGGNSWVPGCIAAAAGILAFPLLRLMLRLLRQDPADLLRDRT
ncbi:MAG: ABC transporter permease [Ruminococcaceae bacterium]|nr:ABC transporter permease [Oscillospiraceae bacterium]